MTNEAFQPRTFAELISEGMLEIGDGYRAKNEELGGDGPIFLRAGHLTDTHIDLNGVERFHIELEQRVRPKMARAGDAVITTKGNSTGRTAYVSPSLPPFVYSPHLSYWRSRDGNRLDGRFLHYWSKGVEFKDQLAGMKASTDMAPYLSLVDQKRLRISIPPIAEQQAIANILGTLDDKIELNRRMNENLEAIAQALFRCWFVDFDPVRVLTGRMPEKPPFLIKQRLRDIGFPNRFQDSELGQIPEGWTVVSVGEEVCLIKGVSYRSDELADSRTALVTLKSFNRGGGYRLEGLKPYIGEFDSDQVVNAGELVVAHTDVTQAAEVIGKPALVPSNERFDTLVASLDLSIARPRSADLSAHFFYLLFLTPRFQDHVYGHTNGTTVLHLSKTGVPSYRFVKPSKSLGRTFTQIVSPIFERAATNDGESRTLGALRDVLLPKLVSGDLRVKDVDKFIRRAINDR